jgi:uncharacterized protein
VKVVIDTNVFVSGVFFGGPPGQILEAWHSGRLEMVLSLEILAEYERVGQELATKQSDVNLSPFLELVATSAELYDCPPLSEQVCADPDDDKFLACAIVTGATHIISGDKLLLKVSGHGGIEVIDFVARYL